MKLIKNKKGQADFIGNLLKVTPKWLLFLFFLLLMTGIVALLSPVFNSFGVFCDSKGEVLKLPETNIITNFKLISSLPDAREISGDNIEPNKLGVKCKQFYNGSFRFWNYGGGSCHYCPDGIIDVLGSASHDVCVSDAFNWAFPEENLSFWNRKIICPLITCEIPDGYYFSSETGQYECLGLCSSQTLANTRDSKLAELGAYPYYANEIDDNSYEGLLKFGCSSNLKVQPSLKGIPIFDLRFWAIGILIFILLMGIIKFAKK